MLSSGSPVEARDYILIKMNSSFFIDLTHHGCHEVDPHHEGVKWNLLLFKLKMYVFFFFKRNVNDYSFCPKNANGRIKTRIPVCTFTPSDGEASSGALRPSREASWVLSPSYHPLCAQRRFLP